VGEEKDQSSLGSSTTTKQKEEKRPSYGRKVVKKG